MLLIPESQVTELTKGDLPTQSGVPVTHDIPDPTTENSNLFMVPPGVCDDAYIQPSASLDFTTGPPMLVENDRAYSGVSALDSPMDAHSEPEMESGSDFDTTPRTVAESVSQLFYTVAFSQLSCPRHAPLPIAPTSASFQIHPAPPSGQTDLSASCADDSSDKLPNFAGPVAAALARPVSPLPPSSPGFIDDYSMDCSDDVPTDPFPLPSSPVRSSSPPNLFTSSPTRHALYTSPPTSPAPTEKPAAILPTANPNLLKRPRSPDTMATFAGDHGEGFGEESTKRKVGYACNARVCRTHAASRS